MKSNGQIIMSPGGGDENQFLVTFQDLAQSKIREIPIFKALG